MNDSVAGLVIADPHRSQYDADSTVTTRREACVPGTGANGANATSGGRISRTTQQIRNLVPKWQETDPSTPGWSMQDLLKAMTKLGVGFRVMTGNPWSEIVDAWNEGKGVALQGDSDQFSNATCSGDFDGDHCIFAGPNTRVVNGLRQRWIDDSVCKGAGAGRWEWEYVLHRYASKLGARLGGLRWGVFTTPVPRAAALTPLQRLINRVRFLRHHEPAAARRWKNGHPTPAHETTDQRTARLTAEATYLTKARIKRLIPIVKSLRQHKPAAAKRYRANHPIPATETLRQRDDRLTAEIHWLRAH